MVKQAKSDVMWPRKWVAYFDILGFSSLIKKASHPDFILAIYDEVLQELKAGLAGENVNRIHFSDTFLFYSPDGSGKSYTWIQSVAKNFIRRCLLKDVPMRGAIAFGKFYADPSRGVFFGEAFVEAYRAAESQDWLGLILTKTAQEKVRKYRVNPEHHQFPVVDVPRKDQRPAYDFHRGGSNDQLLRALQRLQNSAPDYAKHKYQNTINFIQSKKR